jgi:hypothetical protein
MKMNQNRTSGPKDVDTDTMVGYSLEDIQSIKLKLKQKTKNKKKLEKPPQESIKTHTFIFEEYTMTIL